MPPGAKKSPAFSKNPQVMFTKKRLVHLLLLVLACMSVFRLVRLAITTFPYTPVPSLFPPLKRNMSSHSDLSNSLRNQSITNPGPILIFKELKFLTDLISHKAPCNLLIFGFDPEYLILSEINSEGKTIILEDNPQKLRLFGRSNNTIIHQVDYPMQAKDAYKVLKQARKNPSCFLRSGPLEASKCRLALTSLPKEVYRYKWDVIIVDGPRGDRPSAPGRMAPFYSASVLARAGNRTNVVVHDVDRMIEKWFSWEFLCEDNLVSSRGRFWNFFIEGGSVDHSNSTSFCPPKVG